VAFSKIYDIINKLNKKLWRKQMSLKSYLIVVDTTEERFLRSIGRGILNVHISLAETAEIAREQFLKVFNPAIAEQIKNSIYIYDIAEISSHLEKIDITKQIQLFAFLPLAGGRPQKQVPQIAPNEIHELQQTALNQQLRQTSQNTLSPEKMQLLREVGAMPLQDNAPEGTNLRVNASVGLNRNVQSDMIVKPNPTQNLNTEQMNLLSKVGVNIPELNSLYSDGVTITDKRTINSDLADVGSEKPMSDAELAALQNQVRN